MVGSHKQLARLPPRQVRKLGREITWRRNAVLHLLRYIPSSGYSALVGTSAAALSRGEIILLRAPARARFQPPPARRTEETSRPPARRPIPDYRRARRIEHCGANPPPRKGRCILTPEGPPPPLPAHMLAVGETCARVGRPRSPRPYGKYR